MAYSLGPMLSGKFEEARVASLLKQHGHLLIQPKVDGFRLICWENVARSRSWKAWTNRYLQAWAKDTGPLTHGMDGEFFVGHEYKPDGFRETSSGGRAEDGARTLGFYWFDIMEEHYRDLWYRERYDEVGRRVAELNDLQYEADGGCADQSLPYDMKHYVIPMESVTTLDDIYEAEQDYLDQGWEGLMIRIPSAPYKFGRGTNTNGPLIKMKQFEDSEGTIIGFEPWFHNANELQTSNLGYAKRQSLQENQVPLDRLGALWVELPGEVRFKVGVFKGFSLEDRDKMWRKREELLGKVVKFSHQGYGGGYDAPRLPVLLGFRNPIDL